MRITDIVISRRRKEAVRGIVKQDYCLYLFRNPVVFTVNGAEELHNGSTAILYKSGSRQYFRGSAGKGLKYDMVSFSLSPSEKQQTGEIDNLFDIPLNLPDDFMMSSAIKTMKIYTDMYGYKKEEFCELHMQAMFIGLEQAYRLTKSEGNGIPKYPALQHLRRYVYDNPMMEWSVGTVCSKLDISRTYFHRIYSDAFGTTFTQDVIESRLLYATQLLADTDLSVSAIAEKCGYDSDSYFMRQFRQHRGCTPTEYRKRKLSDYDE